MICPLRFTPAGGRVRRRTGRAAGPRRAGAGADVLRDARGPGVRVPAGGDRRTRRSPVWRPWARPPAGSTTLAEGAAGCSPRACNGGQAPAYALLYWDAIDRAGHEERARIAFVSRRRPRSARRPGARGSSDLRGVTVLLLRRPRPGATSARERVDYLDDLWPRAAGRCSPQPRPAGSSRDAFLHVREGEARGRDRGARRAAGRPRRGSRRVGRGCSTASGRVWRARLGQVVVLPAPGRQVWMRSARPPTSGGLAGTARRPASGGDRDLPRRGATGFRRRAHRTPKLVT